MVDFENFRLTYPPNTNGPEEFINDLELIKNYPYNRNVGPITFMTKKSGEFRGRIEIRTGYINGEYIPLTRVYNLNYSPTIGIICSTSDTVFYSAEMPGLMTISCLGHGIENQYGQRFSVIEYNRSTMINIHRLVSLIYSPDTLIISNLLTPLGDPHAIFFNEVLNGNHRIANDFLRSNFIYNNPPKSLDQFDKKLEMIYGIKATTSMLKDIL